MVSKKVEKYLKQYGERNYAVKERKIEKSDLGKYSNRSPIGETSETGGCDSLLSCREEQEEVILDPIPIEVKPKKYKKRKKV